MRGLLSKQELTNEEFVSWSAYHASIQQVVTAPCTVVTLMSLFLECAHSVAMIKHSMNVVKAATEHLNPGQIPVLVIDQTTVCNCKNNTVELYCYTRRR